MPDCTCGAWEGGAAWEGGDCLIVHVEHGRVVQLSNCQEHCKAALG